MKNSRNDFFTDSFNIPRIEMKTALGKKMKEDYLLELARHRKELHRLAAKAYAAAKEQYADRENYGRKPASKHLRKLVAKVERQAAPYQYLDDLFLLMQEETAPLTRLLATPKEEITDLCLLERLYKPSIEFNSQIMSFFSLQSLYSHFSVTEALQLRRKHIAERLQIEKTKARLLSREMELDQEERELAKLEFSR